MELHESKLRGITGLGISWNYRTRNYVESQDSELRGITGITGLGIAWNYRTQNCAQVISLAVETLGVVRNIIYLKQFLLKF